MILLVIDIDIITHCRSLRLQKMTLVSIVARYDKSDTERMAILWATFTLLREGARARLRCCGTLYGNSYIVFITERRGYERRYCWFGCVEV